MTLDYNRIDNQDNCCTNHFDHETKDVNVSLQEKSAWNWFIEKVVNFTNIDDINKDTVNFFFPFVINAKLKQKKKRTKYNCMEVTVL